MRHFKLTGVAMVLVMVFCVLRLHAQALPNQGVGAGEPRRRGPTNILQPPDQKAVDRGQQAFLQSCSFCHGKDANGGDGGPDLMRSILVNHDQNGELIGPVILNGRPDQGMPKFSFTQGQVSDIVAFLHARNRYVRHRRLYEVKDIVVGDPKQGEAYFNGQGRCVSCHSVSGDLAHVATKYSPEILEQRLLFPAARTAIGAGAPDPRTQVTVEVTLPTGESFSGPLKHLDEFYVSMYDSSGDYHTWPVDHMRITVHDPLAQHIELLQRYSDAEMHNLLAYLETLK